ncbi:MAG: hypothetical protein ACYTFU_13025 [Planctomycetota bacterium]|jgi:hypothetical protein
MNRHTFKLMNLRETLTHTLVRHAKHNGMDPDTFYIHNAPEFAAIAFEEKCDLPTLIELIDLGEFDALIGIDRVPVLDALDMHYSA